MDIDEVAAALYGVPPADFTTERTRWVRRAREAGESDLARAVGRLRKPTQAASALNAVTRQHPDVVRRLRHVAEHLRAAQTALDAERLRELRADRDAAVADIVDVATRAVDRAGAPLSPAGREEVRGAAVAALADAAALDAVTSGHLSAAPSYSGFGEVDLSGVVAQELRAARTAKASKASTTPTAAAPESPESPAAPEGHQDPEGTEVHEDLEDRSAKEKALEDALDAATGALTQAKDEANRTAQALAAAQAALAAATTRDEAARADLAQASAVRRRAAAALAALEVN